MRLNLLSTGLFTDTNREQEFKKVEKQWKETQRARVALDAARKGAEKAERKLVEANAVQKQSIEQKEQTIEQLNIELGDAKAKQAAAEEEYNRQEKLRVERFEACSSGFPLWQRARQDPESQALEDLQLNDRGYHNWLKVL